jgi:uncharacterized coiled-coil DUF342 family protein
MTKIDEVSEMLGGLDAKVDNVMEKVSHIDSHLKTLNGTIAKHQMKMADCDIKFASIETIREDSKKTRECINNFKQVVQPHYDVKISSLEKDVSDNKKALSSVKWDYKFWTAIAGLTIIVTACLRLLGL